MLVYQRVSWFSEKHLGKKPMKTMKMRFLQGLTMAPKRSLPFLQPFLQLGCLVVPGTNRKPKKNTGEIRSGFPKKSTIYEGNLHSDHETTVCFWLFGVPDVLKFNGKGCSFLLGTPKLPKISIDGKKTSRNPCVFFHPHTMIS